MTTDENSKKQLQKDLAITPKTASLLLRLDYHKYRDLHVSSPNIIAAQLKDLPDVTAAQAKTYLRGLRRMVWLGTQQEPQVQAKLYPDWTQKALTQRGLWKAGYDDMTGDEVEAHIQAISGKHSFSPSLSPPPSHSPHD
ncbi:hypothetical protein HWV62_22888 [Athelia sp. TMB]|nr:hypothetical protein HWV62_22888 [Athelia sp. TMB]